MISQSLYNFLPFVFAIIVIVFVHEMGHFLVARWCGVKVTDFSVGFGKEIFHWYDKHGTRWKLCWLPLGGYVKFAGDTNAASLPDGSASAARTDPGDFHTKPLVSRVAVVAAGPIANFLLAIAIFTGVLSTFGEMVLPPRIDGLVAGGAAEAGGLKPGDFVRRINGEEITSFLQLQQVILAGGGNPVDAVIERDSKTFELRLTPGYKDSPHMLGGTVKVGQLGIRHETANDKLVNTVYPVGKSFVLACKKTWFIVDATMGYLGRLVMGAESSEQIGGISSMAKGAGNAAQGGLASFMAFLAFISVSIGLINLFPIPMLDGGHLMFYAIEALRGKPLGPTAQEWGMRIGLSFVALLLFVGNFNDIVRLMSPT
jgi:regulator of sigma E protease